MHTKKIILLKPDLAEVYSNMGVALKDQGKFDEAVEAHQKAIYLTQITQKHIAIWVML